jgi:hypothetical protein
MNADDHKFPGSIAKNPRGFGSVSFFSQVDQSFRGFISRLNGEASLSMQATVEVVQWQGKDDEKGPRATHTTFKKMMERLVRDDSISPKAK